MKSYKRVLLKLSGEALMGNDKFGINNEVLDIYTDEIKKLLQKDIQLGIVIGGGNIFRGAQANPKILDRSQGDYMGMMATMINGLALQAALENKGLHTRLMSAIKMEQIAEPYIRRRAIRHLEKGRVVIFGAGTGSPYFTTDSAASLRAIEINADVILKGTKVDGIYSEDPHINPNALKFDTITFDDVYSKGLSVMDLTAFTLCKENNIPIIVFDINKIGNLEKVIFEQNEGTLVHN